LTGDPFVHRYDRNIANLVTEPIVSEPLDVSDHFPVRRIGDPLKKIDWRISTRN
jgi:hypothetical protein